MKLCRACASQLVLAPCAVKNKRRTGIVSFYSLSDFYINTYPVFVNPLPKAEDIVFQFVCLFICLFVFLDLFLLFPQTTAVKLYTFISCDNLQISLFSSREHNILKVNFCGCPLFVVVPSPSSIFTFCTL